MLVSKVGSCSAVGNLELSDSVISEMIEQELDEIYDISDKLEQASRRLSLAEFCYKNKRDSDAYELYRKVFGSFSWHCKDEERVLFEQAVQGLSMLCCSDNECVWEMSSQITGDYMMWKREQEKENGEAE